MAGYGAVVLAVHAAKEGKNRELLRFLLFTMALGAILSPMLIGQIADRYWPSQLLMA